MVGEEDGNVWARVWMSYGKMTMPVTAYLQACLTQHRSRTASSLLVPAHTAELCVRRRLWRRGERTVAVWITALLAVTVVVAGCGSTVAHNRANGTRTTSPAEIIKRRLEASTKGELTYLSSSLRGPTLARVGLPGGDVITISVMRCAPGNATCYQLAEYWEEPARDARSVHVKKHGMTSNGFIGTGPVIAHPGPGERMTLDMEVRHGCAGPRQHRYPYALAFGVLRDDKDTVIDRADGRTIRMKKVVIPAHLHPEGMLMYGLLLPGPNDIELRTPNRVIVNRTRWAGSNEEASCR